MMKKALFSGSFNPLTLGHVDIIERTAPLFQSLIVAVALNHEKSTSLFSLKEVEDSLAMATKHLKNIEIYSFNNLTVDFAKQMNVDVLIRALRSFGDYEWEMSLACSNRKLSGLETLLIFGDPKYAHISSKVVREIAAMKGSLKHFVPPEVERRIFEKL